MRYVDIYDLRDENELLSTGWTEELAFMQDEFYRLFQQAEKEEGWDDASLSENVWEYTEELWTDEKQKQIFFNKINDIVTISSYKYVFQYLMIKYRLSVGKEVLDGFWKYLESGDWMIYEDLSLDKINQFKIRILQRNNQQIEKLADFSVADYHMLLSVLVYELKQEYQRMGFEIDKNWQKYLKKLLYRFDQKQLNEMALVLQMDYGYYRIFRKKVLKLSEINFYDRENVLLYLVLNYAKACGYTDYVQAYHTLNGLYPEKIEGKEEHLADMTLTTTKEIGQWFETHLEDANGWLKESYCSSLFTNFDSEIAHIFELVGAVNRKVNKRSAERIFLEQWKKLEDHIFRYERKVILEKVRQDKKNEVSEVSYVGKQKIYRWLYGTNVYRREKNRNVERKDKEMVLLGDGTRDYFLNSKIFLETRIRDNTFSAFPLDEERQRNLLLTVGFLNFVLESERGGYLAEHYSDRLVDFEVYIYRLFVPCGFMLPYSGNAYDVYLKLLLSCDDPVELFKYIWRLKTDSSE